MLKRIKKYWNGLNLFLFFEIVLILFISLLPLTWLRHNELVKGVDTVLGFNFKVQWENRYNVWKYLQGTGYQLADQLGFLPFALNYLLSLAGLSIYFIHRFNLFLYFFLAALGSWILSIVLFGKGKEKRILRFLVVAVYSFSFFASGTVWYRPSGAMHLFAMSPIFIASTLHLINQIKELNYRKILRNSFFLSIIGTILAFGSFGSNNMVVMPFFLILLFFFLIIFKKDSSYTKIVLLFFFSFSFFFLILNLWWEVNFISGLKEMYWGATYGGDINSSYQMFEGSSHFTSIQNVIRLLSHQELWTPGGPDNDPYHTWQKILVQPIFNLFTYYGPFFLFVSTFSIFSKKKSGATTLLSLFSILLILIFLSKQGSPPFSFINYFILKLPFGAFWRHGSDKLAHITALLIAIFTSLGIFSTYMLIKQKNKILSLMFILISFSIIIFVTGFPLVMGKNLANDGKTMPGGKAKIPSYYWEMGNDIKKQGELFRLVHLPLYNGPIAYQWEKGVQPNLDPIDTYFHEKPEIINNYDSYYFRVFNFFENLFRSSITKNELQQGYKKSFGWFNVKTILLHLDFRKDYAPRSGAYYGKPEIDVYSPYPEEYQEILTNDAYFKSKQYGKLITYEVDNNYFLPRIYIPQNTYIVSNVSEEESKEEFYNNLSSLTTLPIIKDRSAFYLLSDILAQKQDESSLKRLFDSSTLLAFPLQIGQNQYQITLPKEEIYDVYIKNPPEGNFSINFSNGNSINTNFKEGNKNGWTNLGHINLNQKKIHFFISMESIENKNLLTDKFEEVQQSKNGEKINTNNNYKEGENSPTVHSYYQTVTNIKPEKKYQITLDCSKFENKKNYILIEEFQAKQTIPFKTTKKELNQQNCTHTFRTENSTEFATIYFIEERNNEINQKSNLSIFEEAKMVLLSDYSLFFVSQQDKQWFANEEIPDLSFYHKSPSQYFLKVSANNKPYIIVFSETFAKGWKLSKNNEGAIIPRGKKIIGTYFDGNITEYAHNNSFWGNHLFSIPQKKHDSGHFLTNAFSNSWIIEPVPENNNQQFTIQFLPQKIFLWGVATSGFSGVLILTIILILRKRRD